LQVFLAEYGACRSGIERSTSQPTIQGNNCWSEAAAGGKKLQKRGLTPVLQK
jgi:hypothetical protein